ncbi:HAD family hydrolase [Peribacillus cavernae]|uniref:HAD family hydrolase n=1 Tax=Peribacillus cavernae TaxID=1674310 RepID=A0A3S0VJ75_9BACI|nr:HAD family hydrolase [Peribacillus cavernae]MDQ0219717.1 putative hydrolase of the HAD superfamily [Peribacillus cavernae]RUQ25993.1 HAD family hydrolase [Peribacillus cavernae]
MIKAGLFDLDGTLLNRDASVLEFIDDQYDRFHNELTHIVKEEYISRFIELDCRGYVWKDRVYQQLVQEFEIRGLTWEALLQDYLNHFKNSCVAFPNLNKMLDELKGKSISLGIVTNGKGPFQMDNIRALGIEHYFNAILVSEWEGIKKPDPQIFRRAIERLHVTPDECLFVGDHPENDVKAAKNAGLTGIWKKDDQWKNVQADFVVEDLLEISFIMDRITASV